MLLYPVHLQAEGPPADLKGQLYPCHYTIFDMTPALADSADLLLTKIKNLFNRDLALQNDYLRQENKILRCKLPKRVPLDDKERRLLVKYALRIKDHLHEVISIVRP